MNRRKGIQYVHTHGAEYLGTQCRDPKNINKLSPDTKRPDMHNTRGDRIFPHCSTGAWYPEQEEGTEF
jgi:hypothetical protein